MFRFLATADGLRPHWTRFPQGPTGNFARARLPTLLAAAGREIPEQALPGRPPSEPAGLLQLFSGFARRPDPLRAWLRPGFYRPPAAALSEPGAGAAEAAAARGVGAAPRTRARGVGGSLLPGSARPEPSRRCRPARSRRVPGLRATRPGRDLFRPPPPPARPCPLPAAGKKHSWLSQPGLRLFPLLPRRVFSAPVKIVPHKQALNALCQAGGRASGSEREQAIFRARLRSS